MRIWLGLSQTPADMWLLLHVWWDSEDRIQFELLKSCILSHFGLLEAILQRSSHVRDSYFYFSLCPCTWVYEGMHNFFFNSCIASSPSPINRAWYTLSMPACAELISNCVGISWRRVWYDDNVYIYTSRHTDVSTVNYSLHKLNRSYIIVSWTKDDSIQLPHFFGTTWCMRRQRVPGSLSATLRTWAEVSLGTRL